MPLDQEKLQRLLLKLAPLQRAAAPSFRERIRHFGGELHLTQVQLGERGELFPMHARRPSAPTSLTGLESKTASRDAAGVAAWDHAQLREGGISRAPPVPRLRRRIHLDGRGPCLSFPS